MKKKRSDSSKCSAESEDSGVGLRVVEDFYKKRKPRKTKIAPALRSGRMGLKVVGVNYPSRGMEPRKDKLACTVKAQPTGNKNLILVSGPMTTTNTPAKSTEKDSETKNSSKVTSGTSQPQIYQIMTSSQLASLVRVFPLQENVEVFKTSQGELFSSRSAESYEIKDQATYSLRMLKDYFLTTQAEPSQLYSFRWMNLGMMQNGLSQTLSITYRRAIKGSLSSVLEEKVDKKYFISATMLKKIMEKKDAHPDIRWKSGIKGEGRVPFPDDPDKPSRAITGAESGANRMTHGILISKKEGIKKKTKIAYAIIESDYRGLNRNQEQTAVLNQAGIIRRLTPTECERLQGFPDDWTKECSDTQRYRQMGNAVSVPVITAIGEAILKTIK